MRLFPLTVAFKKLELLEIPCVATNAVGYYAQDSKLYLLDHGQHGAGSWNIVGDENTCGDHVQMGINDPPKTYRGKSIENSFQRNSFTKNEMSS